LKPSLLYILNDIVTLSHVIVTIDSPTPVLANTLPPIKSSRRVLIKLRQIIGNVKPRRLTAAENVEPNPGSWIGVE
jgi:hypothetical protein